MTFEYEIEVACRRSKACVYRTLRFARATSEEVIEDVCAAMAARLREEITETTCRCKPVPALPAPKKRLLLA